MGNAEMMRRVQEKFEVQKMAIQLRRATKRKAICHCYIF
jgi:hypothetical protein